jgi:glycosyltransferase involved in cell wall biosynthesis
LGPDLFTTRRLGLGGRYLLCVGALCPRKNLGAAVEAFRRARKRVGDLSLALVGEPTHGWESDPARKEIAGAGAAVKLLGYLPRRELASLYAGAAALLYLSHYEGFGLPVLEAMASGAPVVAARRGGIPEAAGEAALLVDPDRPEETDAALERILLDEGCARELRSLGRARASRFTWERAAREIDAAHAQLLSSPSRINE